MGQLLLSKSRTPSSSHGVDRRRKPLNSDAIQQERDLRVISSTNRGLTNAIEGVNTIIQQPARIEAKTKKCTNCKGTGRKWWGMWKCSECNGKGEVLARRL